VGSWQRDPVGVCGSALAGGGSGAASRASMPQRVVVKLWAIVYQRCPLKAMITLPPAGWAAGAARRSSGISPCRRTGPDGHGCCERRQRARRQVWRVRG
jgi:hypothetical protein